MGFLGEVYRSVNQSTDRSIRYLVDQLVGTRAAADGTSLHYLENTEGTGGYGWYGNQQTTQRGRYGMFLMF